MSNPPEDEKSRRLAEVSQHSEFSNVRRFLSSNVDFSRRPQWEQQTLQNGLTTELSGGRSIFGIFRKKPHYDNISSLNLPAILPVGRSRFNYPAITGGLIGGGYTV